MTDMNDPVIKAIVSARVSLLFNKPFFGHLATRLDLVECNSWCNTAATDGKRLYFNREFVKALQPPELMFLLGHEVLHAIYDHLGRRGSRNPDIWNMANDYIVNYTLVSESVGSMPKEAGGLYDEKFTDEMTSEEVYRILEKNSVKIKMPLDMHLDLAGDSKKDGDGSGGGTEVTIVGGPDGPPDITEEDLQQIRNDLRAAVINAAQSVGAGKVPAGVRRLIKDLTEPVMDWRTMLDCHIQSSVKDDYSFIRPSRRSWACGVILPSQMYLDTIDIAICIDLSGSISEVQMRDFLSEVKGIMELYEEFRITLWTFDTKVYNPMVFTGSNLDDILDYPFKGGGGTDFEVNWEFMKNPSAHGYGDDFPDEIEPFKLVMFTDGYPCGGWGDPNYCDTLFIVHGDRSIEAPFGITAHYTEKKK